MMRGILTVFSFVSLMLFPWIATVVITLAAACVEPLVPLAVGILADTLYYTPTVSAAPFYSLAGAFITSAIIFVRTRLRTSTIG